MKITAMRNHLLERLPFCLLTLVFCAGLCLRYDYSMRQTALESAQRLVQRVLDEGQLIGLGYQPDLGWLRVYPEVSFAQLRAADGKVLASYRTPGSAQAGEMLTGDHEEGLSANLQIALPGWVSSQRDLPLLAVSMLLLMMALPGRSPLKRNATKPVIQEAGGVDEPVKPRLVMELDADLLITSISKSVNTYGYTPEELIGAPVCSIVERFHPNHPRSLMGVSQREGGLVDSLVSTCSVHDATGTLKKVVVTLEEPPPSVNDEELKARYCRLKALVDAVCDNAKDMVIFMDSRASVVYANRSFQATCGTGSDFLAMLSPRDRLRFVDILQSSLEGAPAAELELTLEIATNSLLLEGSLHAFRSPDTGTALAVGMFRDVTEARQLAQLLKLSRERAGHSQKIEALGRLAGGVAHDFNNLLTTMTLHLEALSSCVQEPANQHVEEIALAARKAAGITRQLLLYSRKKPAESALVSCHAVVEDTRRLTEAMRGGARFETQLRASEDLVLVEDAQLDQVLLNLVVNAKDAAVSDGLVEVSTHNLELPANNPQLLVPGTYLSLRVSDNGSGIPPEIQQKIFEPYFTTKEVGKGTGLGLSTVAATVEKAGGHLRLTSRPGRTTFEILLPVRVGYATQEEPLTGGRDLEAHVPESKPACQYAVLLVEDESSIRALVHRLLERQGYQVTSVSTGSAATEILGSDQRFDVLVTDLVLPGVSGPEIACAFQRIKPHGPVLFMSGFAGSTLDGKDMVGHSRFLAKPFSPQQLYGSLRELLMEAS